MQIQIKENQKEIKNHGSHAFPVNISPESINRYESGSFLWHWHPEIELTWIIEGQMQYRVNDQQYLLKKGDGLFGNSNTLHSGYMADNQNCDYLSVTFHPKFIYGYENSLLHTKYVDKIISNPEWPSLKLEPSIEWQNEIIEKIKNIYTCYKKQDLYMELDIHILITQIFRILVRYYSSEPVGKKQTAHIPTERLKQILSYIHEHYAEPVTLDAISSHVNICKSECCRFFKKHMNMTLFEYLMSYRIQQSLPLLKSGHSITEAAGSIGFSDPCYYGKIFKRYMNCSPRQYKALSNA